ncbi:hypothetical protein DSM03_104163 [Leeuwenhoekiella aestuarii]|uniref:Uncharacterized protein n=1 Tax=Leeuwenhoekiella aestuarii TaxID=2249426 RepID=A0A4Q0NRD8_9FLAO|nr:DUF6266 family protein [Leeuwenhoekiella aestuarii]RXG13263.1 hypothetical protein DSM04_105241 [Leeuwenhoekiella aestuarii]RXG15005.1 hypothetical protein DSM03_104163 [Leeuwenhoekiella aestuarii]
MGTFEKGILGGFSGKVGTVIGSRWRGRNVLRSLPVTSNRPPTEAQLEQRLRFKAAIRFLNPIKSVVSVYFGESQGDKSPANLATSYYIKEVVEPDGTGGFEIDYAKVLISKGDLQSLANPTATAVAGEQITLAWDDNSGQGKAEATDTLLAIGCVEGLNQAVIFNDGVQRDATTDTLQFPAYMAGMEIQLYATFITADQKKAATSVYLGAVTLI